MVGSGFHVAKTTDGGKTWNYQWFENYSQQFTWDALSIIEFANDSVGFAAGTRYIFKTSDQGKTWKEIFDAGEYYIEFFEMEIMDSLVYIAGDQYDVFSYDLFNNDFHADSIKNKGSVKNQVYFTSEKNGYAIVFGKIGAEFNDYHFYHTSDSGKSWSVISRDSTGGYSPPPPLDLVCSDDSTCYVLWPNDFTKVTNWGNHWKSITNSDLISNSTGDFLSDWYYNSMNHMEAYNGKFYAFSQADEYTVIESSDSGKTWQKLDPPENHPLSWDELEIYNDYIYLTTYTKRFTVLYRYNLNPTGIENPTSKTNLDIYPTLNEGSFSLRLSSKSPLSKNSMQIVSMDGRQIPFEFNPVGTELYRFKLTDEVPSGMYILKIASEDIQGSAKFVVGQ
jgi:photosystem II stability/assembly factor-like uncharacterized protein